MKLYWISFCLNANETPLFFRVSVKSLISLHLLGTGFDFTCMGPFPPSEPEPEPEQTDLATKVLWTLLCPGSREEHSHCSYEQSAAELCTNAPQVWPEGLHLQAAGLS